MVETSNKRQSPQDLINLLETSKKIVREIRDADTDPEPDTDPLIINLKKNITILGTTGKELEVYARKRLAPRIYDLVYN